MNWKKFFLMSGLGLLVFYILFMAGYYSTSAPSFCKLCHEVTPYVTSWEKSPHKDVPCLYCHEFRGFVGKLHSKTRGLNFVYQKWTGQYTVFAQGIIFEQNCIACHLGDYYNYPNTVRMDYKHYDLIQKDKKCVDCHRNTGHGTDLFSKDKFKNR